MILRRSTNFSTMIFVLFWLVWGGSRVVMSS